MLILILDDLRLVQAGPWGAWCCVGYRWGRHYAPTSWVTGWAICAVGGGLWRGRRGKEYGIPVVLEEVAGASLILGGRGGDVMESRRRREGGG
jgi:hypothetical protein